MISSLLSNSLETQAVTKQLEFANVDIAQDDQEWRSLQQLMHEEMRSVEADHLQHMQRLRHEYENHNLAIQVRICNVYLCVS